MLLLQRSTHPGPRRFSSGPFNPPLSMHASIANPRFRLLQSRPLLACAEKAAKRNWTQTKKEHRSFRHPNRPSALVPNAFSCNQELLDSPRPALLRSIQTVDLEPTLLRTAFRRVRGLRRGIPSLVGTGGIEPPTPAMSRRCSKPLSYVPAIQLRRRFN